VGELVISNLVNRGSVLLNYRIGDRGSLSDDPCPCGRSTRRILELDGRTEDAVVLPDGSLVGAIGISGALAGLPGMLRFRLVQRGATEFDVELVPVDPQAFARLAEQAVTALRPLLPGCDVRPVHRVELELPSGGKHRYLLALERDREP
jgi:phenylacetate-CoA ligase